LKKKRNTIKNRKGLILVVSAPSGAGKTTICKEVLKIVPGLRFSVSCTTRRLRADEKDGRDYHFISEEEFTKKIKEGDFIEWEENHGHFYGTLKRDVEDLLENEYDVLFDVDTRGAKTLKSQYPDAVFVFILPPSVDVLKERLEQRASEKKEVMDVRLERAYEEIKEVDWYDYVIFNDILDKSVDVLRSLYVAETSRRERLKSKINNLIG
jgi:guanylate kinase